MSFGSSGAVRFENHSGAGRPVIFWQKQAAHSQNPRGSKKMKYKSREQTFPLRKGQQQQIHEPNPPANKKTAARQMTREPANKSVAGREYGTKKKKVPETAGTVVLTQKEFDAILDTIGQLALEAETGTKSTSTNKLNTKPQDQDFADPSVSIELSRLDGIQYSDQTSRDVGFVSAEQLPPSSDIPAAKELPPSPAPPQAKELPPSPAPGYRPQPSTHLKPPLPTHVTPQVAAAPVVSTHQVAGRAEVRTSMEKPLSDVIAGARGVPTAHLTKAERKRLQWEREKADQNAVTDWNPWGRPGAGAPVKDSDGKLLTDYKTRARESPVPGTSHVVQQRGHDQPEISHLYSTALSDPPQPSSLQYSSLQPSASLAAYPQNTQVSKPPASMMQTAPVTMSTTNTAYRGGMNSTTPAAVTSGAMPPPAAIRSSMILGEAEPNENRFESAKERERRVWLADLEAQRESQRQRKLSEKTQKQEGETYDKWADHFSTYKPQALPAQPDRLTDNTLEGTTGRVNSAPVAPSTIQISQQDEENRTNIRGQNVQIDPATRHELDEKRKKHLEHQEYIRQQIEEKERLKREDKERRMREEQEEEERLRRERDQMNGQLQQERDKARAKENAEKQRLEALRQAMEQAQEGAEREKHAKRVRKLQKAGHDTTQLNANFEAKMTPRVAGVSSSSPHDHAMLDHSYTDPSPRQDLDQSYRGGKVMTPTKFRQTPSSEPASPRKDYGIQTATDLQLELAENKGLSRESTEIEYHGPVQEKKKVRVISAPKDQLRTKSRVKSAPVEESVKVAPLKNKRPLKLHERPSWGVPKPKKQPVKQSEKDPFYDEKARKREMKRAQRQQAMLDMAEKNCPKASRVPTVASEARSRSRSRDRDDWNQGHERSSSRSPPRDGHGQGHQSRKASNRSDSPPNRRSTSPPIPAIKHRPHTDQDPHAYQYSDSANTKVLDQRSREAVHSRASQHSQRSHHNKYQDQALIQAPIKNNDFVPFIRSSNVLNPAHAESPMPLSREPSVMDRARKAYIQEHDPAKFGYHMDNFRDDSNKTTIPPQSPSRNARRAPDPILNPELVKEHPTGRQTQILQHLSDLRRGLMQKQRELELEDGLTVD